MQKLLLALLVVFFTFSVAAQQKQRPKMNFGEITSEDFAPKVYEIDSSAQAVILFEYEKSEYETDNSGGFNIIYKYHKRMRLLNKNSFGEATIEIPITTGGRFEDEVKKLDASTYNLEGTSVVATRLDKNSIFKDKVTKGFYVKKFTFPALKEGSIIEYQYTIICPHESSLRGWSFQDKKYPTLWSEFDYTIPELYRFLPIRQGYENWQINSTETESASYRIYSNGQSGNYNTINTHQVYAMADIPALKEESFTTTLDNYISKIDFYLLSVNLPDQPSKPIIRSWNETAQLLLKDENFGSQLGDNNNWMKEQVDFAAQKSVDSLEKIKSVYLWLRDNFECTDKYAVLLSQPLKKVMQSKKGSVADINLLLTAMFRKAGFRSNPVLLSTRSHGRPLESYPILSQFNYVISMVQLGEQTYLLDASDKANAFNKLPVKCYNGSGRIIDEMPVLIPIPSDSILDSKITSVFAIKDESGKGLQASFTSQLGYYESQMFREELEKKTTSDYFKEVKKSYTFDMNINNSSIDSLKVLDNPIQIKYDFSFKPDEDIIYINPMLTEATKTNPFKSAERVYPVEMPYRVSEVYVFNMEVPDGYKVDEIPKSTRVKLNEDEGVFEYLVNSNGKMIQLRSRLVLYKANFMPEDYQTLRDFFDYVVKKHSEQIVLKKVN
jgi:hypothetical protein